MSLAITKISTASLFDVLYSHLNNYKPKYGNMHLREARTVAGKRDLRYLHALRATNSNEIEGMISGPEIFAHYKLKKNPNGTTKLVVVSEKGSAKEKTRLAKNFEKEILKRLELEMTNPEYHPKRTSGQFYLKRKSPGTPVTHQHCQAALKAEVLHQAFLENLQSWNLQLLHP